MNGANGMQPVQAYLPRKAGRSSGCIFDTRRCRIMLLLGQNGTPGFQENVVVIGSQTACDRVVAFRECTAKSIFRPRLGWSKSSFSPSLHELKVTRVWRLENDLC